MLRVEQRLAAGIREHVFTTSDAAAWKAAGMTHVVSDHMDIDALKRDLEWGVSLL